MEKIAFFDLSPVSGQKSFYGKAKVAWDMRNDVAYLYSYNTVVVAMYHINSRKFRRVWFGYSATTMKHINAFRAKYGLSPLSKVEWLSLNPYEPC